MCVARSHSRFSSASSASSAVDPEPLSRRNRGGRRGRRGMLAGNTLIPHYQQSGCWKNQGPLVAGHLVVLEKGISVPPICLATTRRFGLRYHDRRPPSVVTA